MTGKKPSRTTLIGLADDHAASSENRTRAPSRITSSSPRPSSDDGAWPSGRRAWRRLPATFVPRTGGSDRLSAVDRKPPREQDWSPIEHSCVTAASRLWFPPGHAPLRSAVTECDRDDEPEPHTADQGTALVRQDLSRDRLGALVGAPPIVPWLARAVSSGASQLPSTAA